MIFFALTLALVGASPLQDALQSSEGIARLFRDFEAGQGNVYSAEETKLRLRLFRNNVKSIVSTNEQDLGWKADVNFFSDMTEEEKKQYLGLNISLPITSEGKPLPLSDAPVVGNFDWRSKGGVTSVKNQGSCGSCWTFGAVGSIEGVHKSKGHPLTVFAEQELLDCVYEGKRDGCQGGWMHDCFTYMQGTQRLAPSSAVSYRGSDGACRYSGKANGLKNRVSGYYSVPQSESSHLSALTKGPIAVAFEVTNACQQYRSGILRDTSCSGHANHAVTMVAYDSQKFAIKNSWGGSWGDGGYVYMARNHHNCKLYTHSSIITLEGAGPDPGPDPTPRPDPDPTNRPDPDPNCRDEWPAHHCSNTAYMCQYPWYQYCMKSCGKC